MTCAISARHFKRSYKKVNEEKDFFLDITSKTGEFAGALLQKYGSGIKDGIYSIPTSGATCECTRKIYRLLELPAEHIYSGCTSYDIIDKTRNKKLLKELADMKFDAIVGNPPYQEEGINNGRKQPLYYLFMNKSFELSKIGAVIAPARFLFNAGEGTGDKILSKIAETGTEIFPDKNFHDAVEIHEFIDSYNVLVSESNGNGVFETVSSPEIAQPNETFAETFLSVGKFGIEEKAENYMKYIKTKFARTMLGTLKTTQNGTKEAWTNIPLQDFTTNSDIDCSKPIAAIDRQLYKKYNLDATEIAFIEKNVREME